MAVELPQRLVLDAPDDVNGSRDQLLSPNCPARVLDLPGSLKGRQVDAVELQDVLVDGAQWQGHGERVAPVEDVVEALPRLHLAMHQRRQEDLAHLHSRGH